uniref:WAP domain-containing protein n=1 Tax=Pelusios castaneus TaxID=367368 RepID=A0A8C8S556_9SAUR
MQRPLCRDQRGHWGITLTVPLFPEKAGVCPAMKLERPTGLCIDTCVDDSDCPGSEKCCGTGCGQQCQVPPPGTVMPGRCPAQAPEGSEEPCFFRCLQDSDCPGNGKCCLLSCGLTCLSPVQGKSHLGAQARSSHLSRGKEPWPHPSHWAGGIWAPADPGAQRRLGLMLLPWLGALSSGSSQPLH